VVQDDLLTQFSNLTALTNMTGMSTSRQHQASLPVVGIPDRLPPKPPGTQRRKGSTNGLPVKAVVAIRIDSYSEEQSTVLTEHTEVS
jgi:hypothetical protein